LASPMHDVGKIGIPDAILLKPGKLTDDEFAQMKKHTEIGARILAGSDAPLPQVSEPIALTHNGQSAGSGYPRPLKAADNPLERYITKQLLDRALQCQRAQAPNTPLGELLLQKNVLSRAQIDDILEFQNRVKAKMTSPQASPTRGARPPEAWGSGGFAPPQG